MKSNSILQQNKKWIYKNTNCIKQQEVIGFVPRLCFQLFYSIPDGIANGKKKIWSFIIINEVK